MSRPRLVPVTVMSIVILTVVACPHFIIKGNDTFQLGVSENEDPAFFLT